MELDHTFEEDETMPLSSPSEEKKTEELIDSTPIEELEQQEPQECQNINGQQEEDQDSVSIMDVFTIVSRIEKKFDEKIAVDEHKNGLFDKLYKERDEYKNDIYGKLLKPFISGAIEIINDLRTYISKMDSYEVDRSLNYLRTIPDDIIELLENNDVELFTEDGDTFNPRTQRAKKIVPIEDVTFNNKIAERIERGYRWNGVILRPEMVSVYRVQNQQINK